MKSNTGEMRQKLKVMSSPGAAKVFLELMLLHTQLHGGNTSPEKCMRIITDLKDIYKRELRTEEVTVATRDIENLIDDLNSGKEPRFINKYNGNGRTEE